MSREGKDRSEYKELIKDGDLAELLGVILGDGYIGKMDRCESLRIVGNSNSPGFAARYAKLIENFFSKKPKIAKRSDSNAFNITLYEKHISERLGIPAGSRLEYSFELPAWINSRKEYQVRFLRGLYEAEGCICHHEATYTHKFLFSNLNMSINMAVIGLLEALEFHPHYSANKVQISRRAEVQNLEDLLQFRHYSS